MLLLLLHVIKHHGLLSHKKLVYLIFKWVKGQVNYTEKHHMLENIQNDQFRMIETQFCNFSEVQGKIMVRFQRGMVEKIPTLNVRLQTAIFDVKVTHTCSRTSSG